MGRVVMARAVAVRVCVRTVLVVFAAGTGFVVSTSP